MRNGKDMEMKKGIVYKGNEEERGEKMRLCSLLLDAFSLGGLCFRSGNGFPSSPLHLTSHHLALFLT